jgi:RNA polymerase sigma-70 factor (ECF subfamily)
MLTTSLTLLHRLRDIHDQLAWNSFVQIYTPLIFAWCRRAGLDVTDASDLVQDVFAILVQRLPEFEHNRTDSFRSWLKTVVLNRWRDSARRRRLPYAQVGNLDLLPANELFEERPYREVLLCRAIHLIQGEFRAETWNAFLQHGIEGRPAAVVARELGLSPGAVYNARYRVVARIREFLRGLVD